MIENNDGKTLVRYDTSANWNSANPVLAKGEIGVEGNTKVIKIGNGSSNWNDLPIASVPTYTSLSEIGITTNTCTVENVFAAMVNKGGTWRAIINQGILTSGVTNLPVGYGLIKIDVVGGYRYYFEYIANGGKNCYRIVDNTSLKDRTVNDLYVYSGTKLG